MAVVSAAGALVNIYKKEYKEEEEEEGKSTFNSTFGLFGFIPFYLLKSPEMGSLRSMAVLVGRAK